MKKLYCGGTFPFDYQKEAFRSQAARDYRVQLLGNVDALLSGSDGVLLREGLLYIGPFYFETPGMKDTDIVKAEQKMLEDCTHAVFLLDDGCCPGTITELTAAALLGKHIAVFYIPRSEDQETESELHSPCWYPITFCTLQNQKTQVFPCRDPEDAARQIHAYVNQI